MPCLERPRCVLLHWEWRLVRAIIPRKPYFLVGEISKFTQIYGITVIFLDSRKMWTFTRANGWNMKNLWMIIPSTMEFRIKVMKKKHVGYGFYQGTWMNMDFTKEHGWTTFRTCILRVWKRQDCLNKRRCVATLFLCSLSFSCCVPSLLRELPAGGTRDCTVSWPACRLPCAQGLEKQQLPSGNPAAWKIWKLLSHCAMFLAQPAICTGRRSPAEMFMMLMFSLVPGI